MFHKTPLNLAVEKEATDFIKILESLKSANKNTKDEDLNSSTNKTQNQKCQITISRSEHSKLQIIAKPKKK